VVRVSCTLPGDVQLLADIPADEVDRLEVGEQVRIYVDRRKTVAVADDAAPPNI
jgi:hypothetical protein